MAVAVVMRHSPSRSLREIGRYAVIVGERQHAAARRTRPQSADADYASLANTFAAPRSSASRRSKTSSSEMGQRVVFGPIRTGRGKNPSRSSR
jgi:hypothetical protein